MLKPKRKITRKEMKKDPLLEKITQVETFVRSKPKQIIYITIGLVAVIVFCMVFFQSKKSANREASGLLGIAELSIAREDYDDAIIRFENLIDRYPGTKSAGMATMLLAQSYFVKENYKKAEDNYLRYIDKFGHDDLFLSSAYNGVGVCQEIAGDHKAAAEYFEKGGDVSPHKFQRHECYINSARNMVKIGEIDRAEMILKMVMDDAPDLKYKKSAEILTARIEILKG